MIGRLLASALVSGLLAGVLISVIQEFTTTPIILHAEEFEGAGGHDDHAALMWTDEVSGGQFYLAHSAEEHAGEEGGWGPADGFERTLFTTGANLVAGVGFAALLVAGFHLAGRRIDGRTGLAWGVAGFVVFQLAPALGLPPEVPGSMAADLAGRQMWWWFAVASTGVGVWLLLMVRALPLHVLGVLLIALPHLVGAPQPAEIGGAVPPELAGHFAAAALVTAFIFWALLGWLAGSCYQRLVEKPQMAAA